MRQGFDNDKYIELQAAHIRERIAQFGGKLYLEFGGKLFDDYHASRVLPGFQPDTKFRMLKSLAEDVEIIGDAEVVPDFIFFNVSSVDGNDDFRLIGKLHQHPELAVRGKARKHPGCMEIVKELSAELQIQLVSELADPLPDMVGLHGKVFAVVEPLFYHIVFPPVST